MGFTDEKFLRLKKFLGFANENFLGSKNFLGFANEIVLGFANENVLVLEISWSSLILEFANFEVS